MSKEAKPVVIIDTREQLPYEFPENWPVIKKALPSGDYSLIGHEITFAVERKSLNDLLGCIFTDRFHNELKRLMDYKHAFLVIEANIYRIRNNRFFKGNANGVIGMLQAIPLKYGVQVLFLDDRETAQSYVQGLMSKYHRYAIESLEKESCSSV